ncbi:MAG: nucleotide exchange factor GrpE [Lawsonibacter sp.]
MSKKDKKQDMPSQEEEVLEQTGEEITEPVEEPAQEAQADPMLAELESLKEQVVRQEDKYLRLCAEYDNYRKRTAKEKESAWTDAKAETASAFLPVYDNLERALKQETADEAYKKGVEMTMNQLKEVLTKLGITEIPAQGQPFDPKLHNAVMHVEDESLGENVVVDVFQAGFQCGEKVIRFAMVKVAN